jgi:hypothetical protein
MTVEFTQEVTSRLKSDHYGWLTTVAKSGQPVPRVSVNLDSDGNGGGGVIVVGGEARVDATDADPREDGPYWTKYEGDAAQFGLTDAMGGYNTRLRIKRRQGLDNTDRRLTATARPRRGRRPWTCPAQAGTPQRRPGSEIGG